MVQSYPAWSAQAKDLSRVRDLEEEMGIVKG